MRKDWKYIVYISIAFGLFVLLKLLSPKQHNWTVTYAPEDKNPYGGYALNALIRTNFKKENISHSYKTLYELKDSLRTFDNIFIVSSKFNCGSEDAEVLLDHVAKGGTAFISAQNFWGNFSDTLQLEVYDYLFNTDQILSKKDTSVLKFASARLDTLHEYYFRRDNVHNYFSGFDTTRTTVIARNDNHQPITIRVKWGKGDLILNSTPMMLTNIYLLSHDNHEFVSSTLSFLPDAGLKWTEYYHRGRMELETPLRFILLNEPLAWAYYISVIGILLFMIFEMKRKQRIIPIIRPLANTTLEFVNTIGNLYHQHAQHKNIAEKKINYLMDQIRTRHWLSTNTMDEGFILALSRKTGKPVDDVRSLINQIVMIKSADNISADTLIDFNEKIEKFNSPLAEPMNSQK